MKAGNIIRRQWIRGALVFAIWTLVALAFAHRYYVSSASLGSPVHWRHAISHALADWYLFAFLSLPTAWLAKLWPLERANWHRHAAFHLAAGVAFSLCWSALRVRIGIWQGAAETAATSFLALFQPLLAKTFYFNLFVYWGVISVTHAFDYYRRFHDREINTLELEKRLTQARLQALQMQLNPHFLFNTLHTISALMHKDVEAADRMISRLSLLLRSTLENTDAHEVPLQQELAFLDRYLEIEQTRFGERLSVIRDIAPDTVRAQVPNLLLQPLVENAIRHGIEPQSKPGQIRLHARRVNDQLQLEVRDNGAGLPQGGLDEEGVGLANTRARLQQLYGNEQKLEFTNAADGGLIVSVSLPFRAEGNYDKDSRLDRG